MSTLAVLKAEIADDLPRSDLTTQIAAAITSAIEHYKTTRFYFNESRSTTFSTVASQSEYTSTDHANIPLFFIIDEVYVKPSGGTAIPIDKEDPNEIEYSIAGGSTGQPYLWSWFDQSIRLFPIPDVATYTIRVIGALEKAAPGSDSELSNVWMVEAYELVRCRAKWYLYGHVIHDAQKAAEMGGPDGEGGAIAAALRKLRSDTNRKRGRGIIRSTQF